MGRLLAILMAVLMAGQAVAQDLVAQDLTALARFRAEVSSFRATGDGAEVVLGLSQPVPWRVRVLDGPPRLILDTREADWAGVRALARPSVFTDLRAGVFHPGWSRLVIELARPMLPVRAGMVTGGPVAKVEVRLKDASAADFAARAALPDPPGWALPEARDVAALQPRGTGPLVVVLDPGHGGIDPGAERDGISEADLMLTFARELKEELLRTGTMQVVLTRTEDLFVPLETRISIARAAGGHVFISLHADALSEGEAVGATIYTLSDDASDRAAAALAERHDRDDLLAGVDLTGQDDLVAQVLMDMARAETAPRVDRLAAALETAIKAEKLPMHRHARQAAGFSVLKSPDIPSVLIELGFLSSARDLRRLGDPVWRARMTGAIRAGLTAWAEEDTALEALR